ncbi:hypothetical protein ACIBFB_24505 [Nocardiopsis sp. NPDC050513]|uniref:hypothetical protein n=1 Tax=Nocardiopsis sp. NPDC050513 TaxID=3364338 RepID=UPI0037AD70EA
MVTTGTRALPRPAHTTILITGMVLMVVLSIPLTSSTAAPGEPELARHGVAGAGHAPDPGKDVGARRTAGTERTGGSTDEGPRERARPREHPVLTAVAAPVTCEQRTTPRDLPDAVPSCALRLAAWEQPWWPMPRPHPDSLPEPVASGDLPPTRAPPLTAPTSV